MKRFERILDVRWLYRESTTGIYYVRKYVKTKGELFRSTGKTTKAEAIEEMDRILIHWLGSQAPMESVSIKILVEELLPLYKVKAKETLKNFERHTRLHLLPFFKDLRPDMVEANWKRYVAHQKTLKPKRKLRHDRMHMISILHYAKDRGLLREVPDLEISAEDTTPALGREYDNKEIKSALNNANPNLSLHIEIEVKMAMRSGEVDKLKWEYINFEKGMITLPAEIIKTRYPRSYPVDPVVLKKLYARRNNESPYVFPNRRDPMRPKSRSDKSWQRLKKELKKEHGISLGKKHWLRHTAVTRFIRAGVPGPLVQKAVGMSDQVMKRVYLHVNEKDLKILSTAVDKSLVE